MYHAPILIKAGDKMEFNNKDIVPALKYAGKKWSEVPESYLKFVSKGTLLSSDSIRELNRRASSICKDCKSTRVKDFEDFGLTKMHCLDCNNNWILY